MDFTGILPFPDANLPPLGSIDQIQRWLESVTPTQTTPPSGAQNPPNLWEPPLSFPSPLEDLNITPDVSAVFDNPPENLLDQLFEDISETTSDPLEIETTKVTQKVTTPKPQTPDRAKKRKIGVKILPKALGCEVAEAKKVAPWEAANNTLRNNSSTDDLGYIAINQVGSVKIFHPEETFAPTDELPRQIIRKTGLLVQGKRPLLTTTHEGSPYDWMGAYPFVDRATDDAILPTPQSVKRFASEWLESELAKEENLLLRAEPLIDDDHTGMPPLDTARFRESRLFPLNLSGRFKPMCWPSNNCTECLVYTPNLDVVRVTTLMKASKDKERFVGVPNHFSLRPGTRALINNSPAQVLVPITSAGANPPGGRLLIWAAFHPYLYTTIETMTGRAPTPLMLHEWKYGKLRVISSNEDPLSLSYESVHNWYGHHYPNRRCVVAVESLLLFDPNVFHREEAHRLVQRHSQEGIAHLIQFVTQRTRRMMSTPQTKRVAYLLYLRLFVNFALTNVNTMCHLLDLGTSRFAYCCTEDDLDFHLYSNVFGTGACLSAVLAAARRYVQKLLWDLRTYSYNHHHVPGINVRTLGTPNLHREFTRAWLWHRVIRQDETIPHPLPTFPVTEAFPADTTTEYPPYRA